MDSSVLADQLASAILKQQSSLSGEPLLDILDVLLPNEAEVWLEVIGMLPPEYESATKDFLSRASRCPDWSNDDFLDFFASIEDLKEHTTLNEGEIIDLLASHAEKLDYRESVLTYFQIIEFLYYVRKDKEEALKWVIQSIKTNGYLDWYLTKLTPQDFFKKYPGDDLGNLSSIGAGLFLDGRINEALKLWGSIPKKEQEDELPSVMLYCLFDYGVEHFKNDVDFLVEDYMLNRRVQS